MPDQILGCWRLSGPRGMNGCPIKNLHVIRNSVWRVDMEVAFLKERFQRRSVCEIDAIELPRQRKRQRVQDARDDFFLRGIGPKAVAQDVTMALEIIDEARNLLGTRTHLQPEVIRLNRMVVREA